MLQKSVNDAEITPKLLFANFTITKDSLQEYSTVNLSKIQFTDGSIKKTNLQENGEPLYQNQLRCVFEDDKENEIYSTIIEHPLYKKFEYTKDDGNFGVKEVTLYKGEFFIRTDYDIKMKYIRIFEKLSTSEEKEIEKFELKK